MTPKRIPTRSGKPMFRYYLKTLIDKDDFDAIQPFISGPCVRMPAALRNMQE